MHAVVVEQVSVGLSTAEVVDRDRRDIVTTALNHGAQHEPADAAKSVDGDLHRHDGIPSVSFGPSAEPLADGGYDGFGGDTEVFVKKFIRRRGSKVGHTDEDPITTEPALPAESTGGLDADPRRRPQHLHTIAFVLLGEQLP